MEFSKLSDLQLIEGLAKLARSERKITHLVLRHINEIEDRKLHLALGFSNLYEYLVKQLRYGEKSAFSRVQAARLLREVPAAAEKIEAGAVNLSQLTKLQQCLRDKIKKGEPVCTERTLEVLNQIECKTLFDTQKILAKEFDLQPERYEILKPQRDDSIRLEITLTPEQYENLEKAKDLLSHVCPDGKWSEVIGLLAEKFVDTKRGRGRGPGSGAGTGNRGSRGSSASPSTTQGLSSTPVELEPGAQSNSSSSLVPSVSSADGSAAAPQPKPEPRISARKYFPVPLKKLIFAKAQYQCEYRHTLTGKRCESGYQLQIDHILPVALGGGDEPSNLRVLCRTHNIYMANKLGLGPRQGSIKKEKKLISSGDP